MSRTSLLLALLLTGAGDLMGAVPPPSAAGAQQIALAEEPGSTALVRSGAPAVSGTWQPTGSAGSSGSGYSRYLGHPSLPRIVSDHAACRARSAAHRSFAAQLALDRAGRHSFHIGTPPPFRVV